MPVIINIDNFDAEVLKSDKPVLVDFWASWCGPCKMLGPIIDQMEKDYPEYKICKVNVDEQQELAAKYKVMSIPTVIAFKNGEVAAQNVGFAPKEKLVDMLK